MTDKFTKVRMFNGDVVGYGSNEEGNVAKITLTKENLERYETFYSPTVIQEIEFHPIQNELAILNKQGVVLIEQNSTVLDLSTITVKHSKMIVEYIDGTNTYFVGVLTGNVGEKCYFTVYRVDETEFATTYTNATTNENVLGVWKE